MRVVQLIARVNRGGTANWINLLVSGLRERGFEVHLLAGFVGENELEDPCFTHLGGERLESLGRSLSLIGDLRTLFEIRDFLKKTNPDVINTHTAKAGVLGRLAAIGLNIKVVHTFHGHLLFGYFSKLKTFVVIFTERALDKVTDCYISVGERVRDDLLGAGIGKSDKYSVIVPGVEDFELLDSTIMRIKMKIQSQEIVVGWLGRLTQIKRPDRVLELARLLPDVIFLIGGDGELAPVLQEKATKNVRFTGWTTPGEFWPACNIALLTSDNEGLPTSLIEAGYAGLPVVAENVGSACETILDGVSGFLVRGTSERTSALERLLGDNDLRIKMGINGKKFATEKFAINVFLNSNSNVYRNC
jgi:glycosyltransferase involved in cell wall biosynthesis